MDKRVHMKQQSYTKSKVFLALFGLLLAMLLGMGVAAAADPQVGDAPLGASNLGDLVWHDLNGNGFPDSGEPGIPGVTIKVWNDDGDNIFDPNTGGGGDTIFATTVTSSTTPGFYNVQITFGGPVYHVEIPSNMFDPGQPLHGYVLTSGSTIYPNPALIIESASIANRSDVDFGFAKASVDIVKTAGTAPDGATFAISGPTNVLFTYTFTNTGETALLNAVIKDDNGTPGNPADDITVCSKPGPYLPNASDTCTTALTISGNYTNTATVVGQPAYFDTVFGSYEPIPNTSVTDKDDAKVAITSSLGDRVWIDANGDGLQSFGELGLSGVTVRLYKDGNPTATATTTTGSNGNYKFDSLDAGSYIVEFVLPSGRAFTTQGVGGDTTIDSNANISTGRTDTIVLGPGEENLTIDAGLYTPVSIGDRAWIDANGNGVQDGGESGLPDVTVKLYKDGNPTAIATTTTGSNGSYAFNNLAPGTYTVEFIKPVGSNYVITTQNAAGGTPATNSDPNPTTGKTAPLTLLSGDTRDDIDAGLYQPVTIGDRVWHDTNANGIQDPGEPGQPGTVVKVFVSGNPTPVATTSTDPSGIYTVTNLAPGTYTVAFEAPAGYVFPAKGQGGDPTKDSNPNPSGQTDPIVLTSGQTDTTIDAGIYQPASIGDRVWTDLNGNGAQDGGELGLPGVVVKIFKPGNPTPVATTSTDGNGNYSFTNLVPGDYEVLFEAPSGYLFAPKGQGSDPNNDSNANPGTGRTDTINLTSGENDITIDAGLYKPGVIGDRVWDDSNEDGVQDAGEPGLPGVTVNLYQVGNPTPVATDVTDGNGIYGFDNLAPGQYYVEVVNPPGYFTSPKGDGTNPANDSNINPGAGTTDVIVIVSGIGISG